MSAPLPTGLPRLARFAALAARLLTARALGDPDAITPGAAREIATLRGLPQKAGLLLTLRHPELPAATQALLHDGLPLPAAERTAALREVSPALYVDPIPLATGSTAQVFAAHARAAPDAPLVLKLLHPGAEDALLADLRMVERLSGTVAALLPSFQRGASAHVARIARHLHPLLARELDLRAEAAQLRSFQRFFEQDHPSLSCPIPFEALSSPRALAMTRLGGQAFDEALASVGAAERREALERIVGAWLGMIFGLGEVHADPHPLHLRALGPPERPLARIGVLDFGLVFAVEAEARDALRRLIEIARGSDAREIAALYGALGFEAEALVALEPALIGINRALLLPFAAAEPFNPGEHRLAQRVQAALDAHEVRAPLLTPPPLVLLLKTLAGLLRLLKRHDVHLSWSRLLPSGAG